MYERQRWITCEHVCPVLLVAAHAQVCCPWLHADGFHPRPRRTVFSGACVLAVAYEGTQGHDGGWGFGLSLADTACGCRVRTLRCTKGKGTGRVVKDVTDRTHVACMAPHGLYTLHALARTMRNDYELECLEEERANTLGYPLFPTLPTGREKWLPRRSSWQSSQPRPTYGTGRRVSFAWSALPTVPLPALRRTPSPCP